MSNDTNTNTNEQSTEDDDQELNAFADKDDTTSALILDLEAATLYEDAEPQLLRFITDPANTLNIHQKIRALEELRDAVEAAIDAAHSKGVSDGHITPDSDEAFDDGGPYYGGQGVAATLFDQEEEN